MRTLGLLTLVMLLVVTGCGEAGRPPPAEQPKPPQEADQEPGQKPSKPQDKAKKRPLDVAAFLDRGASQKTASVRGRLVPIAGRRMVLSGKDSAVLMLAPRSFVHGVRRSGFPAVVTGSVRRVDRELASQLDEQVSRLERATKRRRAARRERVGNLERNERDPYLVVDQVAPQSTNARRLRDLDKLERRGKK